MINLQNEVALHEFEVENIYWLNSTLILPVLINSVIAKKKQVAFVTAQILRKTFESNTSTRPVYLNPESNVPNSKVIDSLFFLGNSIYKEFFKNNVITNNSLNGSYSDLLFPVDVDNIDIQEEPVIQTSCMLPLDLIVSTIGPELLPLESEDVKSFPDHVINIFLLNKDKEVIECHTLSSSNSAFMPGTRDYLHIEDRDVFDVDNLSVNPLPAFEFFTQAVQQLFEINFLPYIINDSNQVLVDESGPTVSNIFLQRILTQEFWGIIGSVYLDFSLISGEGENTIQTSLFETSFNPAVVQTNSRGLSPVDILLRRSFFGNSNDFENSPIKILKDEINQNPSSFLRISVDLSSRIDINSDLRVNSKKYFLLSKNDVDRYYDALVLNFKDYYVKKNTLNKILITPAGSNSVYEIKFLDLAREFTSSIVFRNNSNEKKITIKLNGSNVSELFLNASIIANNSILASNETFDFELIYNNMFTRSFYIRNRSGDISNIQVYLGEILIFPQEDSVPISPNQTGENSDENESNISDVMFEDDES